MVEVGGHTVEIELDGGGVFEVKVSGMYNWRQQLNLRERNGHN